MVFWCLHLLLIDVASTWLLIHYWFPIFAWSVTLVYTVICLNLWAVAPVEQSAVHFAQFLLNKQILWGGDVLVTARWELLLWPRVISAILSHVGGSGRGLEEVSQTRSHLQ